MAEPLDLENMEPAYKRLEQYVDGLAPQHSTLLEERNKEQFTLNRGEYNELFFIFRLPSKENGDATRIYVSLSLDKLCESKDTSLESLSQIAESSNDLADYLTSLNEKGYVGKGHQIIGEGFEVHYMVPTKSEEEIKKVFDDFLST